MGGGATNRPLGVVPGQEGGAAQQGQQGQQQQGQGEPQPEQTWWQKNWMYIMGA